MNVLRTSHTQTNLKDRNNIIISLNISSYRKMLNNESQIFSMKYYWSSEFVQLILLL